MHMPSSRINTIRTTPIRILSTAIGMVKNHVVKKAYPQTPFPSFEDFVTKVRKQNERSIYASASELYYAAFFGRDSIEAAEDLLTKDPSFARELIPLLASHQGTKYNLTTEEEPGRIHHEYRMSPKMFYKTTGEKLPEKVAEIYNNLSHQWGGNDRELTYYGSTDATPLYVKLIADYILLTNDLSLLNEVYFDKDGRERKIQESLLDSMEWLVKRILQGPREDVLDITKPQEEKRLPLLEYKRVSSVGITNQIWKDSGTSVIHEDGKLPNNKYPIATIELQGHAYDALIKASQLLRKEFPEKTQKWTTLAKGIQEVVFKKFWLEDRQYFAMAMDRDKNGKYRLVKTLTSDQTELLNTELFDIFREKEYKMYVSGIINSVYTSDFLTDVGMRCRSLAYDNLVDFWDYHGTRAVWIKATYDFVTGLEKQGFYKLAEQLKIRILNGTRISGNFIELFYVSPDGKVAYDPLGKKKTKHHEEIAATTMPEHMQTWTASAVAAIEYDFAHPQERDKPVPWKAELEDKLLRTNSQVTLITSPRKAYKAFPKNYSYTVNVEKGLESEKEFKKRQFTP